MSLAGESDRAFALASVTKLLTAYGTLIAVEDRFVSLDDPLGPSGSTLAHLLAHASGLSPSRQDVVLAPVGSRRIYSNAGFELIGAYVARSTQMASFASYLEQAVFGPLQMTHTFLVGSPASGATSTVVDLAHFGHELLSPTLVSGETLYGATAVAFGPIAGVLPGFGRQDPCDWGLGFEIRDAKSPHWAGVRSSPDSFGHFGQSGTFLLVDPCAGRSVIYLGDRDFGPWAGERWPTFIDAVLAESE